MRLSFRPIQNLVADQRFLMTEVCCILCHVCFTLSTCTYTAFLYAFVEESPLPTFLSGKKKNSAKKPRIQDDIGEQCDVLVI